MKAFGSHEWFICLKGLPERVASRAVPSSNSTIMMQPVARARRLASRCVMRSPPSSPNFLRAEMAESAKRPRPWMGLRPTLK